MDAYISREIWLTTANRLRPGATAAGGNGPHPVARCEPERGQVIVKKEGPGIAAQCPGARHAPCVEAFAAKEFGLDNMAMKTAFANIFGLTAGKEPGTFG